MDDEIRAHVWPARAATAHENKVREMNIRVSEFIGAIARPFSIICTSAAAAYATAIAVHKITGGFEGAALIGAIYAGLALLYWGKSYENKGSTSDGNENGSE